MGLHHSAMGRHGSGNTRSHRKYTICEACTTTLGKPHWIYDELLRKHGGVCKLCDTLLLTAVPSLADFPELGDFVLPKHEGSGQRARWPRSARSNAASSDNDDEKFMARMCRVLGCLPSFAGVSEMELKTACDAAAATPASKAGAATAGKPPTRATKRRLLYEATQKAEKDVGSRENALVVQISAMQQQEKAFEAARATTRQVEIAVRLAKEAFAAAQQAYKDFEEQPQREAEPTDMELDEDALPAMSAEELAAATEEHARLEEESRESVAAVKKKGAHLALLTARAERTKTEQSQSSDSGGEAATANPEVGGAAEPSLASDDTAAVVGEAAAAAAAAAALEAQAAVFTEALRAKKATAQRVALDPGKYGAAPY